MGEATRKVWVTKYALTQGIFETDVSLSAYETDWAKKGQYVFDQKLNPGASGSIYQLGKDAFFAKEVAQAAAHKMRTRKLVSLHRQISKLEKMRF